MTRSKHILATTALTITTLLPNIAWASAKDQAQFVFALLLPMALINGLIQFVMHIVEAAEPSPRVVAWRRKVAIGSMFWALGFSVYVLATAFPKTTGGWLMIAFFGLGGFLFGLYGALNKG